MGETMRRAGSRIGFLVVILFGSSCRCHLIQRVAPLGFPMFHVFRFLFHNKFSEIVNYIWINCPRNDFKSFSVCGMNLTVFEILFHKIPFPIFVLFLNQRNLTATGIFRFETLFAPRKLRLCSSRATKHINICWISKWKGVFQEDRFPRFGYNQCLVPLLILWMLLWSTVEFKTLNKIRYVLD